MKVTFDNTPDNWKKWGDLVIDWILGKPTPTDTVALKRDMDTALIQNASVPGPPRRVDFIKDDGSVLRFLLPSKAAVDAGSNGLQDSQPYPLGIFYDIAFAPAHRPQLLLNSSKDLAIMRIGEYTILECQ
jgi:hypothetical protein